MHPRLATAAKVSIWGALLYAAIRIAEALLGG